MLNRSYAAGMSLDRRAAGHWSGVADAYASTFAHLCAGAIPALLEHAAPGPDDQVLEVGSGSGLLSARLADAGARVTAVEPDPDMLRVSADVVPPTVRRVRGGLPQLPVRASAFDLVLSNFVVNHVSDPRAAVRELARATRPGGRVLLTIWPGRPPRQGALFAEALERAGGTPLPPDLLPPERDFPRSVEGLTGLCTGAGLEPVLGTEIVRVWRIAFDEFWRGLEAGIGRIGEALLHQEPAVRQRMREEYVDLSRPLLEDGELVLTNPAVLVVAGKA